MAKHTEIRFEEAIEQSLLENGGYVWGDPKTFDATLGLFPSDVLDFIQGSQQKRWQKLSDLHGEKAGDVLLSALVKELASKHVLHVLRHGFKCYGKSFSMAHFAPNTGMNPQSQAAYEKNILRVVRQVHFSEKNPALSLDLVLSVNGLPLVTMELKNSMTGQNVQHAMSQYCTDRDPREPIFRFKERAIVHFAVDTDQVYMATKLAGKSTFFLPFNQGQNNSAGNPPALPGKYRTSYLWEEVLSRDSLLDLLARFVHLEIDEKQVVTAKGIKRIKKETMIFPRYHQLDCVRKLVDDAREKGSGHNYLVKHSAGSGKSNSIAWLAHRLSSLHNGDDQKIFDTVVVITDRRVLDQQLQNTIYQFEHKKGVVEKIDENTQQLTKALSGGVPIIITTIQKFPFISQALETLAKKGDGVELDTAGKRFAVIVDEAHSSQSGETAMELRKVLNSGGIAEAIAGEFLDDEEDGLSDEAQKEMLREMLKRPRQDNISFFAFTATPKFKTQAIFNEPDPATNKPPFHHYSMRQAIEEGFILDVLENYTTYKTYSGLIKSIEDDPQVPKRKTARELARFISLHDHNITQKVEMIIEHFRTSTMHKIGGRAKAMVVTGSRLHAVRYKQAFDRYVSQKGYEGIKSLVAFSGSVEDPDLPDVSFTEAGMNKGIKDSELPKKFASDDFQVLLVADKYQTGFDQPLLHTMYVDKRLAGIQAVQTLSRLNRTIAGKEECFVLDFVNEREEIYKAFKPYYEATPPGEESDPHQLYDLQHKLMEGQLFDETDINAFCEVWYRKRSKPTAREHQQMNGVLDLAIERFKKLEEEDQEQFRGQIASFKSLYAFLSQIIPYRDSSLEKLYTYGRRLEIKLPRRTDDMAFVLDDEVAMQYYRLEKISDGSIDLSEGEAEPLRGPTEVGTGKAEEEKMALSQIVDKLNERFGTEFTKADQLFFDQITEIAVGNEALKEAVEVNKIENVALIFDRMLDGLLVDSLEGNEKIVSRLMNDKEFRETAGNHLLREIYNKLGG